MMLSGSVSTSLSVHSTEPDWLARVLELLRDTGFAIVPEVASDAECSRAREALAPVVVKQAEQIGAEAFARAREAGDREVRVLFGTDPFFFRFLEHPVLLALVDAYLSPTATLRFQQSGVIPGCSGVGRPGPWHMNFRRVVGSAPLALEVGFALDGVEPDDYVFALGSHQRPAPPSAASLDSLGRTFAIPRGAMFVFDGTLWHREGVSHSPHDRLLLMHQFVPHYVKPHIDYVRALGEDTVRALAPRTRRLLGWESRVPASLAEYYVAPDERRYLPGQG
jgi:ectoine hydroxylase-related dioxygenase (phytanoyl-CoA dioxygenase family)